MQCSVSTNTVQQKLCGLLPSACYTIRRYPLPSSTYRAMTFVHNLSIMLPVDCTILLILLLSYSRSTVNTRVMLEYHRCYCTVVPVLMLIYCRATSMVQVLYLIELYHTCCLLDQTFKYSHTTGSANTFLVLGASPAEKALLYQFGCCALLSCSELSILLLNCASSETKWRCS